MKDWFGGIAAVAVGVAFIGGYVMNIVQLVQGSYDGGLLVVKVAGIFVAPLGVIMGWVG